MYRRLWPALLAGLLVSLLAAACGGGEPQAASQMAPAAESPAEIPSVPDSELPAEVRDAPASVQEAYRFAIANKELLEQIPCFCGCSAEGHTSNYNCYVAEDGGPGAIIQYDYHALGWGICVDITRDVMAMVEEGKSVEQMREVINGRYGSLGPSTDG